MNKKILNHFKTNDPILYSFAKKLGPIRVLEQVNSKYFFLELCETIAGQQLSSKAADAIFARFEKLYPKGVTPKAILKTNHEKLRSVGMSNAKARYLKYLAQAVFDGKLKLERLDKLTDAEVIKQLIQVKGIGPWTAEMFLMFTLGRENVFSHGDLGLRKGLMKIYGFKKEPGIKKVEKIVSKWSPYKTYGSLILWNSLEIK